MDNERPVDSSDHRAMTLFGEPYDSLDVLGQGEVCVWECKPYLDDDVARVMAIRTHTWPWPS